MSDAFIAGAIVAALGWTGSTIEPIGVGLASDAWLVRDGDRRLVLRVNNDTEYPATYPMEHALMERVGAAGAAVPSPIAGDWDTPGWPGPAFSVTTWVPGTPLALAARLAATPQLASFVRALQSIEVEGFGALEVRDGRLVGERDDREAGILAWGMRPFWPLGDARLEDHVPLAARPTLSARLVPHADAIRRALITGPTAILHSDMHEENVLEADGAIHVIDFGEALVGPAAWEIAATGYFLGWPVADALLDALVVDAAARDRWRREASAIALAFGVYRWHQDHELGMDEDAHDETFLEDSLDRQREPVRD